MLFSGAPENMNFKLKYRWFTAVSQLTVGIQKYNYYRELAIVVSSPIRLSRFNTYKYLVVCPIRHRVGHWLSKIKLVDLFSGIGR